MNRKLLILLMFPLVFAPLAPAGDIVNQQSPIEVTADPVVVSESNPIRVYEPPTIEEVEPPAPESTQPSVSAEVQELRALADEMRENREKIEEMAAQVREAAKQLKEESVQKSAPRGVIPPPEGLNLEIDQTPKNDPLVDRVANLERRMTVVEEKLEAIVSIRKNDGTVEQKTVEIDSVSGYGDFEVPVGGKVVAINGVPIQRGTSGTRTYRTPNYNVVPDTSRRVRLLPRPTRTPYSNGLTVGADGCLVNPLTGEKVSCPAPR